MLLAPVKAVRDYLGFDDMTDINEAIAGALHAAEADLSAVLDTSFERATVTDRFWVNQPGFVQGPHAETQFRLRRGLLAAAPLALKSYTPSILSPDDAEDVSAVMMLDLDKGIARDVTTYYSRQYVTFTYQTGFEADGTDPDSYNLLQVPSWLQVAAKHKALMRLADSPSITQAGIKIDVKSLDAQYAQLVNKKARYCPMGLLPL